MRVAGRIAVAVLALLGMSACAQTITPIKPWSEFRVPGADFAVSMPSTPEVSKDTVGRDGSVSRAYHLDQGTTDLMVSYAASVPRTKKPAPLDAWLDKIRDELIAQTNGKLREENRLSLDDSRGMELVLDVPKSGEREAYTLRGRFYVKHTGSGRERRDVLYKTVVKAEPGLRTEIYVSRFLNSFHFVTG